jgi:hypothetical protein
MFYGEKIKKLPQLPDKKRATAVTFFFGLEQIMLLHDVINVNQHVELLCNDFSDAKT